MEIEICDTHRDLLRRIMALPHASRARLVALLYAVDDAVDIRSELHISAAQYRFVIEVIFGQDQPNSG